MHRAERAPPKALHGSRGLGELGVVQPHSHGHAIQQQPAELDELGRAVGLVHLGADGEAEVAQQGPQGVVGCRAALARAVDGQHVVHDANDAAMAEPPKHATDGLANPVADLHRVAQAELNIRVPQLDAPDDEGLQVPVGRVHREVAIVARHVHTGEEAAGLHAPNSIVDRCPAKARVADESVEGRRAAMRQVVHDPPLAVTFRDHHEGVEPAGV